MEYETAEGKWTPGVNSHVTRPKTENSLVENKPTPGSGAPVSGQL